MSRKHVRLSLAAVGCVASMACSAERIVSPTGPRDEPGLLIFYGDTARVVAPDAVTRGVAFDVSFTTAAGGCTRAIARDDVGVGSTVIEIRPYDHNSGGQVCTQDLMFLAHVVHVRVDTPGTYVIRVIGEQRGGPTGINVPAELTRTLVVR